MRGRDDRHPGGGRLERRVRERVRTSGGDGHRVDGAEQGVEVGLGSRVGAGGRRARAASRRRSSSAAGRSAPGHGVPATSPTAPIDSSGGSARARASTSWPFQSLTRPRTATANLSSSMPSAARGLGAVAALEGVQAGRRGPRRSVPSRETARPPPATRTAAGRRRAGACATAGHAQRDSRVELAHVLHVRDPERARERLAGRDHGRVRVHERGAALSRERLELADVGTEHAPGPARAELRAPQDREVRDHDLDARVLRAARPARRVPAGPRPG